MLGNDTMVGLSQLGSSSFSAAGRHTKGKETGKKKKKKTPVASKDEPTQFLSVINMLEDKVWSYSVWISYSVCPLTCGLQLGTNSFFFFNIYLAASSLSFRAQTLQLRCLGLVALRHVGS